jgi:hypothetical protein
MTVQITQLREGFRNPPRGFGTVPWWIWNGRMEEAEMARQLHLMADAGIEGWMLWARFGMEIDYLSDEYLERVQFAVRTSAALGLDVWIFDEYAWPSGTARNKVREFHPEYHMRVLSCLCETVEGGATITRSYDPPTDSHATVGGGETAADGRRIERVIVVPLIDGRPDVTNAQILTDHVDRYDLKWEAPPGHWQLLVLISRENRSFIDSMNPDAVEAFISQTHERYRAYVGDHFGKTIKGFFLDEPRYLRRGCEKPSYPEATIPFTRNMSERLQQAGLANVDAALASVFCALEAMSDRVAGCAAAQRVTFWDAMTTLYRNAYFGQLAKWSAKYGMEYAGDCFTEERVILIGMGDYCRTASPLHRPGMDSLCDVPLNDAQYRKAPRMCSSLAEYHGSRAMAEGPGLLGWDATLQRIKANTDWLLAGGITFLVPNAFFYTVAHEQYYEPPSYFYQWTLWPHYKHYDRYTRRLAWILSQGTPQPDTAVLYPTTSLWANYSPPPMRMTHGEALASSEMTPTMRTIYDGVVALSDALLRKQVDFNYIDENWLGNACVVGGKLRIGQVEYSTLVLPALSTISREAWRRIDEFEAAGGRVIAMGDQPVAFWDDPEARQLPGRRKRHVTSVEEVCNHIKSRVRIAGDCDAFAVRSRRVGDADVIFLCNLSAEPRTAKIAIASSAHGAEVWDAITGVHCTLAVERQGGDLCFHHEFAANESLLVVCHDGAMPTRLQPATPPQVLMLPLTWQFDILGDNLYLPPALRVSHAWTERRPWEGMAEYRFDFVLKLTAVPSRLLLVLDYVQLYQRMGRLAVYMNGVMCTATFSDVIDSEMLQYDLSVAARVGDNAVQITLLYTDYADLSPDLHRKRTSPPVVPKVRVMGDFQIIGDALVPAGLQTIELKSWADMGYPFYSGPARYRTTFKLPMHMQGLRARLVCEALADVAAVRVNDRAAGVMLWPPKQLDITSLLQVGENTLELIVTNSQANQMYEEPRPAGLLGQVQLVLDAEGETPHER